jgi:leader peptidase (prepilin peptidase)/N-methyltransferase
MTAVFFVYIAFLIIGSFIDLEFMIIPDAITIGGLVLGLVTCAVFPQIMNEYVWWKGLLKSFVGAMAGGISLFLIAEIASFIYKKEAMGMGDVKLLAMIGSFIGWKWALFTIFTSSLLGTIAGVILIFAGKAEMKGKIPFGPYLALGSVISLLWGKDIVNWYLKMLG